MKMVAKLVKDTAVKRANSACPWWLYVQKVPDKVKRLRKF